MDPVFSGDPEKLTYKKAGVDIDLGDECSQIMYQACKQTWNNRRNKRGEIKTPVDDFSGLRFLELPTKKSLATGINFDGVGTKIEAAERLSDYTGDYSCHQNIAFDLLAMVCDDAAVRGAEPVALGSILDVNQLNKELIQNLAEGMVKAAEKAGVAVVNGEIAELGDRIGGFGEYRYNWGASVLWMAERDKLLSGKEVKPGDKLVAFKEEGIRSNGLSLARKILEKTFGEDWHRKKQGGTNLAQLVLQPSTIYTKTVLKLLGYYNEPETDVKAIAHITGGGIPGKLSRALKPSGLGAEIDKPLKPGRILIYCQDWGKVDDKEAYKTWNMGQGMIMITDQPDEVISVAQEDSIQARIIGEVKEEPGITIWSEGYLSKGKKLEFEV